MLTTDGVSTLPETPATTPEFQPAAMDFKDIAEGISHQPEASASKSCCTPKHVHANSYEWSVWNLSNAVGKVKIAKVSQEASEPGC